MDWKLLGTTFLAIFVAEMGDKTQLATLAFAGGGSSRWVVFVGASLALIATTGLAVLGGGLVARYVPPVWLKRAAGCTFLVLGVLFLLATEDAAATSPEHADGSSETGVVHTQQSDFQSKQDR